MRFFKNIVAALSSFAIGSLAMAAPILLRPGQCILVGGSEVCAMGVTNGGTSGTCIEQPKILKTRFFCRLGKHADSEVGDVKTYAVLETVTMSNGTKQETSFKNFGNHGKEDCEKEAKRLNDEQKEEAKSKAP